MRQLSGDGGSEQPAVARRGERDAAADRLAQSRARARAGESAVDPVKGFAKSWAQWRRDREAERFDAIADQIDSGKALGASNRPAPRPPGDREEVRRPPARSLTRDERVNPTISASLGGVQAFLAGRPSTNCHSDCPVARLRLCPFSHRAWSIGGPAPGVSIRAGPPPVTRGVPPGNVATCAPHFGQDGSLILASLSLARGLQVALPDRGPVRCGTGYETRHAEHVAESGWSTKGVRARGPTPG
jgi:hypothetical protein